jgi:hypothetical protein
MTIWVSVVVVIMQAEIGLVGGRGCYVWKYLVLKVRLVQRDAMVYMPGGGRASDLGRYRESLWGVLG